MREITEKDIRETRKDIYLATLTILSVVIFLIFAFRYLNRGDTNVQLTDRYSDYNDGWTVVQDGMRSTRDLPLEIKLGESGEIVFKKKLPDVISKYSVIATRNYHMAMEVRIDGNLVATYPNDTGNDVWNFVSDEWTIIDLSDKYARGNLEIKFTDQSVNPFSGVISNIYYGDNNSVIQHLVDSTLWLFLSGLSLMLFGIFLIVSGLIYRQYSDQKAYFAMGLVLFCFGVWLANRSKMPLGMLNSSGAFLISVIALLAIGPSIFLYSYYKHEEYRRLSKGLFQVSIGIDLFVMVTCFVINYNIQSVAMSAYFIALGGIVYNGVLLARACFGERAQFKSKSDLWLGRIEFFSTCLFPIAGILEMVIFKNQLWTEVSGLYRIAIIIYAVMYLVTILWRNYLVLEEKAVITERLQASQLELMMGQIQPHFIFNTLSSIRTLVKVAPDTAYSMLYDFSNYLRANVDNITNLDGIMFAAEVEHIKSYVNIEKVRFGDRLNVEYDIQVSDFAVPPLSIQPLVENAIKHGVCQKAEGGTVVLKSYEEKDSYVVEINDTGVGLSEAAVNNLFSVYLNHEDGVTEVDSAEHFIAAMKEIASESVFLDENGDPIKLTQSVIKGDYSGNGEEIHKSTGMKNIILRLKEISDASIVIKSRVGVGTDIKVLFSKEEEE